jgi:hypothetical protein
MACGNEEPFGDGFDDTSDDQTSLPMCASSASVVESAVGGGCCQGSETSVHVIGEAVIEGRNVDTSPVIEHVPAGVASVHEAGASIVRVKKECTVLASVAAGAAVVDACVVISDD